MVLIAIAVFCIVISLYNVKKLKHKTTLFYSIIGGVYCPLLLSGVALILDRFGLSVLFILVTVLASVIISAFTPPVMKRERLVNVLKNIDDSEPLRFKDALSWSFMRKLERKHGERKAVAIYTTVQIGFAMLILAIIYLLFIDFLSEVPIVGLMILGQSIVVFGILHRSSIRQYQSAKKDLEKEKNIHNEANLT